MRTIMIEKEPIKGGVEIDWEARSFLDLNLSDIELVLSQKSKERYKIGDEYSEKQDALTIKYQPSIKKIEKQIAVLEDRKRELKGEWDTEYSIMSDECSRRRAEIEKQMDILESLKKRKERKI